MSVEDTADTHINSTTQKKRKANDWDNAWKEIIQQLLPNFLEFLVPDIYALIDWSHEPVFLEQELRQASRRARLKKTAVDKLVRVRMIEGEITTLLIHIEFQNQKELDLPLRLYTYNTAIFSLLQQPLVTVAILGDRDPHWRPDRFGYRIGRFRTLMEFPIVKLMDYEEDWDVLKQSENPFVVVVMAHLKGMETRRKPQSRLEWKVSLTQALFERHLDLEKTYQLVDFIDWLMVLDDKREALFDLNLRKIEEEYQMETTIPPRQLRLIARHRQEAELEGRLEGKLEGELQTLRANIIEILEIRFGSISEDIVEQLNLNENVAQLRILHRTAVKAANMDEFRTHLM